MSLFLACADWHITPNIPENRIDDFPKTQKKKIIFLLKQAIKYDAPILLAGDMFDSAVVPDSLKREYIKLFRKYKAKIIMVPGQHDLRYHSNKLINNTPIGILEASGCINILRQMQFAKFKKLRLVGAGWGNIIPVKDSVGSFDILLLHKMVVKDGPLWPGQKDFTSADYLLKGTKFKYIISGDNHLPFIVKKKGRYVINCGSLMRSASDQLEHKPRIYLIDTKENSVTPIFIPIKPSKKVFDLHKIKANKEKKENKKLNQFIDSLTIEEKNRPDFTNVLNSVIKQSKPKKKVKDMINQILQEKE